MPNKEGFDIIVEVGGTDTMSNSIQVIKLKDVITVLGVVTGEALEYLASTTAHTSTLKEAQKHVGKVAIRIV